MSETYKFEILCIDQKDAVKFKKPVNFIRSLSTIESLWKDDPSITEELLEIVDDSQNIKISVQPFDTSKMATGDRLSSAYCLTVEGSRNDVEPFRSKLLDQLKDLGFDERRILFDEVSNDIAIRIYPLLNKIENLLRRYIVRFFITKIGTDWWSITVSKETRDNVKGKISNETVFSERRRVVVDVTLLTFDQLGKLIYSQSSVFTKVEDIFEKIKSSSDLQSLKDELLEGNYVKYFKDTFEQQDFREKWKKLTFIRNKVAHSNYFSVQDLDAATSLVRSLEDIINDADRKIDEFTLSISDKEAVRKAVEDVIATEKDENKSDDRDSKSIEETGDISIIDSDSSHGKLYKNSVSEEELIAQLKSCSEEMDFVGLKHFVRNHLGNQGYLFNSSYALINLLADKNIVEIYEVDNPYGEFNTTAIKLIDSSAVKSPSQSS